MMTAVICCRCGSGCSFSYWAGTMYFSPRCSWHIVVTRETVGSLAGTTSAIGLGTFSVKVEKRVKSLQVPSHSRSRIGTFWRLASTGYFSKTLEVLPRDEVLRRSSHCFIFSYNGHPEARAIAFHDPMLFFVNCRQGSPMGISNNANLKSPIMEKLQPLILVSVSGCIGRWHSLLCLKQSFRRKESFLYFLNALQQACFCFKT